MRTVAEVRIVRVERTPRSARRSFAGAEDVTFYRTTDGRYPGVYDGREHLGAEGRYVLTAWGAAVEAGRAIRKRGVA